MAFITLAKAAAIQKKINSKVGELYSDFESFVNISAYDVGPLDKLSIAHEKNVEVRNVRLELIRILFAIRASVNVANYKKKVNEILVRIEHLKSIKTTYGSFPSARPSSMTDNEIINRHEYLKSSPNQDASFIPNFSVAATPADYHNDSIAAAMESLDIEITNLKDRLAEINAQTTILINDDDFALLVSRGIN